MRSCDLVARLEKSVHSVAVHSGEPLHENGVLLRCDFGKGNAHADVGSRMSDLADGDEFFLHVGNSDADIRARRKRIHDTDITAWRLRSPVRALTRVSSFDSMSSTEAKNAWRGSRLCSISMCRHHPFASGGNLCPRGQDSQGRSTPRSRRFRNLRGVLKGSEG